jgi:hypothetical protein
VKMPRTRPSAVLGSVQTNPSHVGTGAPYILVR